MKKIVLSVFSLVLALFVLVLPIGAVEAAKPDITTADVEVVLYDEAVEAKIVLMLPTCYGITGTWSMSDELMLTSASEVDWAAVSGSDPNEWFKLPLPELTATYSIPANTADGSYTVTFTCTMFTGGDYEPVEGEWTYTATIKVTNHVCSDMTTDSDHTCDDEKCQKENVSECEDSDADGDHNCDVCGEEGVTEHKHDSYTISEDTHQSVCSCGLTLGDAVEHTYTEGSCVCGAEEPVSAGLLGDLDLDGDVDSSDLTLLARHIAGIELLTGQALENADVNGDDVISANDVTDHARYIAGIIDTWNE